jgi:hypothetical protein
MMKSPSLSSILSLLSTGILLATAHHAGAAITIASFSPAANDRFANHPGFIGLGLDFSGVGRDANGRWAVMLSPTVFLSANHYRPSESLIFYPGNDPSVTPVTVGIASAQQIGSSDLYIGQLQNPVGTSIRSYSFVTISTSSIGLLSNALVVMSGISPTTSGYGSGTPDVTDHAIGTNRIEGYQAGLTIGQTTGDVLLTVQNASTDTSYGFSPTSYEAQLGTGDSGSPLFVISNGNLVVTGIAWAVGSTQIATGVTRNISAFTYTGSYASDIHSYISATAVPEPSGLMLAGLACLAMAATGRHRSLIRQRALP